jgi:hypothetical protein
MASLIIGMRIRLTMKAGKSSAEAGVLPSASTSSLIALKVSSSVAIPRISSTSVAADDGIGPDQRAELLQDLALDLLVLDDAFNYQVAVAEQLQSGAHGDAGKRGRLVVAGDLAVTDLALETGGDAFARLLQPLVGNVRQTHVVTGDREDLSDAVAHLAGADDADAFDLGNFAVRLGHGTDPSCWVARDAGRRHPRRLGYSAASSSGRAWNRSATKP